MGTHQSPTQSPAPHHSGPGKALLQEFLGDPFPRTATVCLTGCLQDPLPVPVASRIGAIKGSVLPLAVDGMTRWPWLSCARQEWGALEHTGLGGSTPSHLYLTLSRGSGGRSHQPDQHKCHCFSAGPSHRCGQPRCSPKGNTQPGQGQSQVLGWDAVRADLGPKQCQRGLRRVMSSAERTQAQSRESAPHRGPGGQQRAADRRY